MTDAVPRLTADSLAEYVGAPSTTPYVEQCWAEAAGLVADEVGTNAVPPYAFDRACLEAGAELFHRKTTKNGMAQFATADGGLSPARIARDPMVAARPFLAPYLPAGMA